MVQKNPKTTACYSWFVYHNMKAKLLQGHPEYLRNGVIHEGVKPDVSELNKSKTNKHLTLYFYLISQCFIQDKYLCSVH